MRSQCSEVLFCCSRPPSLLLSCLAPKQAQLEAVSKERGTLLDEVHRLREENAEARHTIKRLQQQQAAAAASAAAVAAQQAQQAAGRQGEAADGKQQEPAGAQQEQQGAAAAPALDAAVAVAAERAAEQERQQLRQEHAAEVARLEAELSLAHRQNAELQQQLAHAQAQPGTAVGAAAGDGRQQLGASPAASAAGTPTAAAAAAGGPAASALISHSALRDAAQHDQQPAAAQQAQQAGALPPELAALLPTALYSLPASGPAGGGPGLTDGEAALQLTSSIYLLLDALEEDKRQMVAALNAKQVGGCSGRPRAGGPGGGSAVLGLP